MLTHPAPAVNASTRCRRCGRPLTDPTQAARGIGPICQHREATHKTRVASIASFGGSTAPVVPVISAKTVLLRRRESTRFPGLLMEVYETHALFTMEREWMTYRLHDGFATFSDASISAPFGTDIGLYCEAAAKRVAALVGDWKDTMAAA